LKELYTLLKPLQFRDGDLIIAQGDPSKEMFFILEGKVDVINNVGVTVASMGAGECFGEMGLVFSITRTASIKACGPVKVTSLSKEDFMYVRAKDDNIEYQVKQIAKVRFVRFQEALYKLATTTGVGSELSADQIKIFTEVFSFWDRDNDLKLTKEETKEMMETISGKLFGDGEIEHIIKMMDADRDGVISFEDFKTKIWNLRWFIDPDQMKELQSKEIKNSEDEPFWGLHWAKGGCDQSAQSFLSGAFAYCENAERIRVEGIYRLSGESKTVDVFRAKFQAVPNSIKAVLRTENLDVHCITGLVKSYFRELPEPLFPFDLYQECIYAYRVPKREKVKKMINVLNHLPEGNRIVLRMLTRHLNKVCSYGKENLMNPKNMAIVFGPTLLRPRIETSDTLIGHSDSVSGFIEKIIKKPSVFLADDNKPKDFKPTIKVEPYFPPPPVEEESPSGSRDAKKKRSKDKKANSQNDKKNALGPPTQISTPARVSRKSMAFSRKNDPDESDGSEGPEFRELFDFMRAQSKANSVQGVIVAYKEVIYNSTLQGVKCSCGHTQIERNAAYCSHCGTSIVS